MVDLGGLHHWEISAIAIGLFCLAILAVIYGVWLYLDYKKRLFLARAKFLYQNGKAGSTINRSLVPKEGPEGTEMEPLPPPPPELVASYFVAVPDEFVVVETSTGGPHRFARVEAVDEYHCSVLAQILDPLPGEENVYSIREKKDVFPFTSIVRKNVEACRRGDYFEIIP